MTNATEPLRFRIGGVSPLEQRVLASNPLVWALEDALDPELPVAYAPSDPTPDQFLARRVMRFRWELDNGTRCDRSARQHSEAPSTAAKSR
jgi:hypothetical protein